METQMLNIEFSDEDEDTTIDQPAAYLVCSNCLAYQCHCTVPSTTLAETVLLVHQNSLGCRVGVYCSALNSCRVYAEKIRVPVRLLSHRRLAMYLLGRNRRRNRQEFTGSAFFESGPNNGWAT